MSTAGAAWRSVVIVTVVALVMSDSVMHSLVIANHAVVLVALMGIAAVASSLMVGSLVPGLVGASVGVGTDLLCVRPDGDPTAAHGAAMALIGALLTVTFSADRGRQRRGEPSWFAGPWLTVASLVIPLALAIISDVFRSHSVTLEDLRAPLAISLLIILTSSLASYLIGLPDKVRTDKVRTATDRPDNWPPIDGWTVLNSMAGHAVFALSCVIFLLLVPILLVIPARQRRVTSLMRFGSRLVMLVAPGVTWRATGDLNALPPARVVVANHVSFLDILCTCVLPTDERQFLAKPWVLRAPVLGWVARSAGVVSSETWDATDQLARPTEETGSLVIFPSGSRDTGATPLRFRPGAFVLADRLEVPVLPVVIVGTGLAAAKGTWWIRPADLTCVALPALTRLPDETIRAFAERCRQTIAEARLQQLADDLRHGRQQRWLTLWTIGQTPRLRQAMANEWQEGHWHAILEAPLTNAQPWLLLGLGMSSCARVIRMLHPASPLIGVDADQQHRGIARATWFQATTDQLTASLSETFPTTLPSLGGIVISMPPTPEAAPRIHAALLPDTWIIVAEHWAGDWAEDWARLLQCTVHAQCPGMRRLIPTHFDSEAADA